MLEIQEERENTFGKQQAVVIVSGGLFWMLISQKRFSFSFATIKKLIVDFF